ncbi:unnamed protein product [Durusdinium trenchii]|uniref:Ubiquitin-like domain-containing protein n=1 Tax=Durusdinium trenchii TaxID=1381693 RepID=A0ABP0I080_9DINO
MLFFLDLYIFGEDPTTYSKTPCRIGGLGHIVNIFLVDLHEKDIFPWLVLRLLLLGLFVSAGLVLAKKLKSRLALRFEMFTYKGSYFIIGFLVLTMNLFICAKTYNWIRWKILCNDLDGTCHCEDAKCGGYISNDLHIRNDRFASLTQCGAFLADSLAVFSVLDLILQDDSMYHFGKFSLCGTEVNLFGLWEKHRTRILWGSFGVLMVLGVIGLWNSTGALAAYQLMSVGHRSNIGRMVIAGALFIIDLCIVTQDLDFPHFENSLEVMLLGTNIAFEGSFINYIMVFVSMLLDLNCLYTLGWYEPTEYGQYFLGNSSVCSRSNVSDFEVNCSSPKCPKVEKSTFSNDWRNLTTCYAEDRLLQSRYNEQIHKYRLYLAAIPIMIGIFIFASLFRLAGRSWQNMCRRVVISNAFAAKRIQEFQSVEMAPVFSEGREGCPRAVEEVQETAMSRAERLLCEIRAADPDVASHRVIVVTAGGVKAFDLRDNPRSPFAGFHGAWMRPHVFCRRLRWWLRRRLVSLWQAQEDLSIQELADSGLQLPGRPPSSSRDHLYARVKDLKEKLRSAGSVRTDVPFRSVELLWQGRLLHDDTMLRSLGADAVFFLLYDRWSLRRKRLAAWRCHGDREVVA